MKQQGYAKLGKPLHFLELCGFPRSPGLPEALRAPPGGPRGAAGTPKTAPRGANSAPRRPQEAPGESQEPGFGAALAATLRPPGAQEPRELILDPAEGHFGGSGDRFWTPPGAHIRSTGAVEHQASKRAHMQNMQCTPLPTSHNTVPTMTIWSAGHAKRIQFMKCLSS